MERVIVVGGSLAGMAAAARLAKHGHSVELFERTERLGGRWAAYESTGVLVDDAPAVIGFPAPWRDLFHSSGRGLEPELGRSGHALVPADPAVYTFADGSRLHLPTERGEQYAALSEAYGSTVAARWRDQLDRLDDLWQELRPLGLEAELTGRRQLTPLVRRYGRQSLAELAAGIGHPRLTALIRSIAHRQGGSPERTPALAAVDLVIARRFGRWRIDGPDGDAGRSSVLVEALHRRLELRGVSVHTESPVTSIAVEKDIVAGVSAAGGRVTASAVISGVDPWQTLDDLLPRNVERRTRRRLHRLRPALSPTISHRLLDEPSDRVGESVRLSAAGVPAVSYRRPLGGRTVESVHDFGRPRPDRSAGIAWHGLASWLRRPPVTAGVEGLYLAGPWSPGGSHPSAVVLSGSLAAYAIHGGID